MPERDDSRPGPSSAVGPEVELPRIANGPAVPIRPANTVRWVGPQVTCLHHNGVHPLDDTCRSVAFVDNDNPEGKP